MVLAVGCALIAELTRNAVGPEEILSSRAKSGDPSLYARICRCPVRFGQNQTGLVLGASALRFALPEADIALHEQARTALVSDPGGSRRDMRRQVRHLLRPLLLMGRAGMKDAAARLGLHPRALRRRLQQEGTTFEALKDEVRYAAARELLRLGSLSITDIAVTLNYATASAFVHAFRRWSGEAPGVWRKKARFLDAERCSVTL